MVLLASSGVMPVVLHLNYALPLEPSTFIFADDRLDRGFDDSDQRMIIIHVRILRERLMALTAALDSPV